jgi:hypothetical protein
MIVLPAFFAAEAIPLTTFSFVSADQRLLHRQNLIQMASRSEKSFAHLGIVLREAEGTSLL